MYHDPGASGTSEEEDLRRSLRRGLHTIKSREPLEPTYTHFLLRHAQAKPPQFPSDPMYRHSSILMAANLRERVESYMKSYGVDGSSTAAGRHRPCLEEGAMKAAFTLRENKAIEQEQLIAAATAMKNGRRLPGLNIDEGTRKNRIEAMARGLQEERNKKSKWTKAPMDAKIVNATDARNRQITLAKQKLWNMEELTLRREREFATDPVEIARLDEQITKVQEQAKLQLQTDEEMEKEQLRMMQMRLEHQRQREAAHSEEMEEQQRRKKAVAQEKKSMRKRKSNLTQSIDQRQQQGQGINSEQSEAVNKSAIYRLQQHMESPQQALYRVYYPIFQALWVTEFDNLGGTNPFRIVIDKHNCEKMGVPDYCQVVVKPMNLTYIREKVDGKKYTTLQEFYDDVELLIDNCILYNNEPSNPYHIAALLLRKKYKMLAT